jgi:L-aminopeptidase/D-esterase-like protein
VTVTHTADGRPRALGLGIALPGDPGPLNAITDVDGVEVGVTTLISGDAVRTGVTAILPRGRAGLGQPCAAGWNSLNCNGERRWRRWHLHPVGRMDDLYTAVVQSVEEAVLNALVVNDDMVGRDGHRSPRLPHDRLVALLAGGP